MKPCIGDAEVARRRRKIIAGLFAAGKHDQAMTHRLSACCHATDCGRLCEHLVKAPGKALVHCVASGEPVELYASLDRPEFVCPAGRF